MIIHIKKSILFTVDPDIRFAREYNLPKGTLKDIWRRYKLLDYTIGELCEFHLIKTGHKRSKKSMRRWMWRTEIYSMTLPIVNKGVETVNSSYFRHQEWKVIKELSKNLKSSVQGNTKTIV